MTKVRPLCYFEPSVASRIKEKELHKFENTPKQLPNGNSCGAVGIHAEAFAVVEIIANTNGISLTQAATDIINDWARKNCSVSMEEPVDQIGKDDSELNTLERWVKAASNIKTGNDVKRLRQMLGLNRSDFARRADMLVSVLESAEKNNTKLHKSTLVKIANAVNERIEQFAQ